MPGCFGSSSQTDGFFHVFLGTGQYPLIVCRRLEFHCNPVYWLCSMKISALKLNRIRKRGIQFFHMNSIISPMPINCLAWPTNTTRLTVNRNLLKLSINTNMQLPQQIRLGSGKQFRRYFYPDPAAQSEKNSRALSIHDLARGLWRELSFWLMISSSSSSSF
ncbi:hypothetical protein SAMN05421690_102025 [Nitrosomonas sp. Nm51]|nr:hypothetical protein SAMN05421690_102025 [Nitrosomonas sp. Nm51]